MKEFFRELFDDIGIGVAIFAISILLMFSEGVSVSETQAAVVVTAAWYRKLILVALSGIAVFGFVRYRRGNATEYGFKFWVFTLFIVFGQTALAWRERFVVNEQVLECRELFGTETVPWGQLTSLTEGTTRKGKPCFICRTASDTHQWSYRLVKPALPRIQRIQQQLAPVPPGR